MRNKNQLMSQSCFHIRRLCLFVCYFQAPASPCKSSGCPAASFIDQDSLELRKIHLPRHAPETHCFLGKIWNSYIWWLELSLSIFMSWKLLNNKQILSVFGLLSCYTNLRLLQLWHNNHLKFKIHLLTLCI